MRKMFPSLIASLLRPGMAVAAASALLLGAPACNRDKPAAPATEAVPAARTAAQDAGSASCSSDSRVMVYQPGLKVAGNSKNLSFVITQASPTPPAGGNNVWHVQVLGASGAPSTAYTLSAAPFMPDHGHGPQAAPTVKAEGADYVVSGIDFFMGGVWRITLTAKDDKGNVIDAANVFFCVPG